MTLFQCKKLYNTRRDGREVTVLFEYVFPCFMLKNINIDKDHKRKIRK
jgi:hypothetical protein